MIEYDAEAGFKLRADTALVTRSRFVKGEILLMKGEQFADGRTRIIVPEGTDDATIERMTNQLEAHNAHMKRMEEMIAALNSLPTHPMVSDDEPTFEEFAADNADWHGTQPSGPSS